MLRSARRGPFPVLLAVVVAVLCAATTLVALGSPASATVTTITLTSAADTGPGTLRAAFTDASTGGPADGTDVEIVIPAGLGTITLASTLAFDGGSGGAHALTVTGSGTTITGDDTFPLVVVTSTGTTTLDGLTLTRGNSATVGGAIATAGSIVVAGSTFADNTSVNLGGAINSQGAAVITDSVFTGNEATADSGGGIWATLSVTTTRSTFTGNITATYGAAVISGGPVTATDSVFDANVAPQAAGAFAGNGVLTAVRSTFTNHHSYSGSALYTGGDAVVVDSTFANNSASGYGGAIAALSSVTATNSTFADNTAASGAGAAILTYGPATVAYSTLTGNATTDPGWVVQGATIALFASVLESPGDNTALCSTAATSSGYSVADDSSCGLTGVGDVQSPTLDPLLGPLGDHGGPTPTRVPLLGSPLVGAIPNAACQTAPLGAGVVTDQRGVPRPTTPGGPCDIGAVQFVAPPPEPDPVPEPTFTG